MLMLDCLVYSSTTQRANETENDVGDLEARLSALEEAMAKMGNPGHLSSREYVSLRDYIEAKLVAMQHAWDLASRTINDELERIRGQLRDLQTFKDTVGGKASTSDLTRSYIISGAGLLIAFVSLVVSLLDKT